MAVTAAKRWITRATWLSFSIESYRGGPFPSVPFQRLLIGYALPRTPLRTPRLVPTCTSRSVVFTPANMVAVIPEYLEETRPAAVRGAHRGDIFKAPDISSSERGTQGGTALEFTWGG